ncbi:MAG: DUF11 domain-containing protein [Cellulosilyticum sp.]|nr:DUF11 domain-containing protein [Cellulosilyticum sp.]
MNLISKGSIRYGRFLKRVAYFMPLVEQYSDRLYGNITFIGNVLTLSRRINNFFQTGQRVAGTFDIGGAFVTTDTTSRCGTTFPYGTTCDLPLDTMYIPSNSEAVLNLPNDTEVVYAELIWGGSYRYGNNSIEDRLDNPITFQTPLMQIPIEITPIEATKGQYSMSDDLGIYAYTRSAIVTDYVAQAGSGSYTVGRVPAILSANDINEAYGFAGSGWTLAVVYRYLTGNTEPLRSVTLYVGGVPIISDVSFAEETLTDFVTPNSPDIEARLLLSAFEGDYSLVGDQVFFATTGNANLTEPLSGPNNLAGNFFASQINNDEGLLNTTTGTFSNRNHLLNSSGTAYIGTSAARQGWDITNIQIPPSHLDPLQTSATLRVASTSESVLLNAAAIVIDTNEPNLEIVKSSAVSQAVLGDEVLYTLNIINTGTAAAEDVVVTDSIPIGMEFVVGSVTIDGVADTSASIVTGVSLGTLASSTTPIVVTFRLRVTSTSGITNYQDRGAVTYTYFLQPIPYTEQSNIVTVTPVTPGILVEKSATPAVVTANDLINYAITVTNTGDIPLTNIHVYDINISPGLTVDESSVLVDGQPPVGSIASGILISQINEGESSMITFRASINNILWAAFENTAKGTAQYTVNPDDVRNISDTSDPAVTDVIDVLLTKTVNLSQAIEGQQLTYTVTIRNNSSLPIDNVVLQDIIDSKTTYDSTNPIPYATLSTGYSIGTIPSKDSAPNNVYTLTFTATIKQDVSGNVVNTANLASYTYTDVNGVVYNGTPEKATVTTDVQDINVQFNKVVTPTNAAIGDTVQYSIAVTNLSTEPIENVVVRDTSADLSYMSISNIRVNNVLVTPQPTLATGISLGTLGVGAVGIITFNGTVLSTAPDTISNQALVDYSYFNGQTIVRETDVPSDVANVEIIKPELIVEKYASTTIIVNDGTSKIIEYTVYVRNTGNVDLTNVIVTDILPERTTYRPNSTYVGSVGPTNKSPEPSTGGILVGRVPVNSTATVRFSVNVNF